MSKKETKLIIVRHGQSVGNLTRRFLGRTDLDLTETGVKQARLTGEFLKNEQIDAAYSSPLRRALDTCREIVAFHPGLEIETEPRIAEIYAGKWENMPFTEVAENYEHDFRIWKEDIGNAVCTGGESLKDVYKRVSDALKDIVRKNAGKTVLLTSHGAAIRSMTTFISGLPVERMKELDWASNASVTIAYHGENGFRLETLGYDEHIGDLRSTLPKSV